MFESFDIKFTRQGRLQERFNMHSQSQHDVIQKVQCHHDLIKTHAVR